MYLPNYLVYIQNNEKHKKNYKKLKKSTQVQELVKQINHQ